MNEVLPQLTTWVQRGERVAVATVIAVRRSAPQPPGAALAVTAAGEVVGAVSGGCVEGAVIEIAHEVLREHVPRRAHFGVSDEQGWGVGLPCGGEIEVWVQEYQRNRLAEVARTGGRGAEVTLLEGKSPDRS